MILSDKKLNYAMKAVENKIRKGESVSDDELSQAVRFYSKLSGLLDQLGPRWYFAADEARRLFSQCRQYQDARKSNSPFAT